MSFVTVQPGMLATVAGDLHGIGAAMATENAAAATSTTGVIPAAADVISALTAAQFAAYGQMYQTVGARAVAVHQQLAAALAAGADSYEHAEAANMLAAG